MSNEYLISLFVLALSMSWTPGPNNALLANSGAKFGYMRTVPHVLGVLIGFSVMMFLIAVGLGQVFKAVPILREGLRFLGAAILLWLAWKIGSAPLPNGDKAAAGNPWTFPKAFVFQWVNPKAWVMCVSIAGAAPETSPVWLAPLLVSLVFFAAGVTSANGWALFGVSLQNFLSTPLRYRVFNLAMAALIVLTVLGIIFADLSGAGAEKVPAIQESFPQASN